MPVHRVPTHALEATIVALEAAGEEIVWPPIGGDEDVLVYTRPGRLSVNADELETRRGFFGGAG